MAATDTHETTDELLEAVFSERSVLQLRENLESAMRRVGGWWETATSQEES
jgi:hypothetical protein